MEPPIANRHDLNMVVPKDAENYLRNEVPSDRERNRISDECGLRVFTIQRTVIRVTKH